jgi:hypothetical protein
MNVENLGYSKKTKSDHKSSNSQIRRMCKNQLYFDINVVYVIEKRSSLSAANRATRSKWDVCKIDFRLSNTYPKLSHLAKTFDFVRRLSTKTNIVKKALLLTG